MPSFHNKSAILEGGEDSDIEIPDEHESIDSETENDDGTDKEDDNGEDDDDDNQDNQDEEDDDDDDDQDNQDEEDDLDDVDEGSSVGGISKVTLARGGKKKTGAIDTKAEEILQLGENPTSMTQLTYDSDEEDEDDETMHQKLLNNFNKNSLLEMHPQVAAHNYDEIYASTQIVRDKNGFIIDALHKTNPVLTKYEKTRVLGQRTKQLNAGHKPFVTMSVPIIDNYLVAEAELNEKKLPFIIQRPIPNGSFEYWNLKDLEIV